MKEVLSAAIAVSVYKPISNSSNKAQNERERERDRLIFGWFTAGIVVVTLCNIMRKRKKRARREERDGGRARKRCNCICYSS